MWFGSKVIKALLLSLALCLLIILSIGPNKKAPADNKDEISHFNMPKQMSDPRRYVRPFSKGDDRVIESSKTFNFSSRNKSSHHEKRNKIFSNYKFSEDFPEDLRSDCKMVTKVGFMKTHKTASSTVQNILIRYGIANELNFVLGSASNHLNDPRNWYDINRPFQMRWIENMPWHQHFMQHQSYDLVVLHTRWNQPVFEKILGNSAKFVTILRDPGDAFESLFSYAGFETTLRQSIHDFISRMEKTEMENQKAKRKTKRLNIINHLGFNQQLWDLGASETDLANRTQAQHYIDYLDSKFHLVMIADYMEESLVLLADLLCLPLHLFANLKINARKPNKRVNLSEEERIALKHLQYADELLYEYFLQKLKRQIFQFGEENMRNSVNELKRLEEHVRKTCVIQKGDKESLKKNKYEPYSKDVIAYKIREYNTDLKVKEQRESHSIHSYFT